MLDVNVGIGKKDYIYSVCSLLYTCMVFFNIIVKKNYLNIIYLPISIPLKTYPFNNCKS